MVMYACTFDNPLAKARGLSLRKGVQTILHLPPNRDTEVAANLISHTIIKLDDQGPVSLTI